MNDKTMLERKVKIGKRISSERKKRHWSQEKFGEELSKKMGGSISGAQNTISNWEKGVSHS